MATNFPNTLDSYTNPTSSDHLGDAPVLHSTQHTNLNDSVEAVEAKLGIDFSSSNTSLDYIANLLILTQVQHPQGLYREIAGGVLPTSVAWYTDATKTIKLVEKIYAYAGSIPVLPTTVTLRLYDGTVGNTLKRTITDSIVYTRVFETSRTRTIT